MDRENKKANVICFSNHKGGVGKTCSTCNIGAGLAQLGKKVLMVDLDPQANLTLSLGYGNVKVNLYNCLTDKAHISDSICNVTENLDLVPSSLDLAGAEVELSSEAGRETILKGVLDPVMDKYEFILIDCPPSLSLLTMNAFTVANEVYVPVQAQFLSLVGMDKLTEVIKKVKKRLNNKVDIGGFIITQFDPRMVSHQEVESFVVESFKEKVFKTRIRNNISLAEAPSQGKDIFRYKSRSNGADDYRSLCVEIVEKYGIKKKEIERV
ncbi:AAA family ATPase [Chlamydiales bacterium]|nr:AAA family ATPase [Chlamydiales bacterium]